MKLKITLNEDLIKLIKNFRIDRFTDEKYGIDTYALFGGTYLYEEMANILGYQDKIIPETAEYSSGPRYEEEYEKKMIEYDEFLLENLLYIEEILHQFCDKGGLKHGIYTCKDYNRIWSYEVE